MNNYERIKNLSLEEMAEEIKLIANWDAREKNKANKIDDFYINYLKAEIPREKVLLDDDLNKINKVCLQHPIESYEIGEIVQMSGLLYGCGIDVIEILKDRIRELIGGNINDQI